MSRTLPLSALLAAVFATATLGGCVATQNIPVSTDPSGALIYLDGKQVCAATPCSVEVPKDQDHLLTVIKPGYRQKDVPLRRVYDTVGVLRDSAMKGVKGGASAGGVLAGTVDSMNKKEADGSAYILEPRLVTLRLRGENEPEPARSASDDPFAEDKDQGPKRRADGSLDPVELGVEIFKMIGKGAGQNAAPEK